MSELVIFRNVSTRVHNVAVLDKCPRRIRRPKECPCFLVWVYVAFLKVRIPFSINNGWRHFNMTQWLLGLWIISGIAILYLYVLLGWIAWSSHIVMRRMELLSGQTEEWNHNFILSCAYFTRMSSIQEYQRWPKCGRRWDRNVLLLAIQVTKWFHWRETYSI